MTKQLSYTRGGYRKIRNKTGDVVKVVMVKGRPDRTGRKSSPLRPR